MKITIKLALAGAVSLGVFGCGDTAAQKLAADSASTTVAYEKQVDNKITAENGFYAAQRDNLIRALMGYQPDALGFSTSNVVVVNSIYYGTVVVSAERDARVTAEAIATSNGQKVMGPVLQYLDAGVNEEQGLYTGLSERETQISERLTQGLTPLNEQKAKLETIRARLVTLSQPLSDKDQMQQLVDLGKATQKILKSEKK